MNKGLFLLSSIGLGVGLAYMLEPTRGRQRRMLARDTLKTVSQRGLRQGYTLGRAPWTTYKHRVGDVLADTSRDIGRRARGALMEMGSRLRYAPMPHAGLSARTGRGGVTKSLLLLGSIGLGAGAMYLLDPEMGKRRRALVRDKWVAYRNRTGTAVGKTARDMKNRVSGLVTETRARLRREDVPDDEVLAARVRAQIGHLISHPGAIEVTAHQGRVTLSGPILAAEVDKLLSTVESVRGVTEVVNQLEVHEEADRISGLQGGNTTR